MLPQLKTEIRRVVKAAQQEDCVENDITTQATIPDGSHAHADILLKEDAVVCGLPFLEWIFEGFTISLCVQEGEKHQAGTVLAQLSGPTAQLFSLERTALNLLQHTCGIATITARYVQETEGTSCEILDTRKTLPGLRVVQKYAVKIGGGTNHRFSLADRFLIKDNHLAALNEKVTNPIQTAVTQARRLAPSIPVEVEVENLEDIQAALDAGADVLMFDNMSLHEIEAGVKLAKGKAYIEASGGITLEQIRPLAQLGVDGISIGALTHSVKATDLSLNISNSYTKTRRNSPCLQQKN